MNQTMIENKSPALNGFDIAAARHGLANGVPVSFHGIDVICCRIHGRNIRFAVDMVRDPIQRTHRQGQFYEAKELSILKGMFPLGGIFVDIGANVGNHSLFVASFLSPMLVIPVEPNPRAYRLLLANVALNGLSSCFDLSQLGYGVSNHDGGGFSMEVPEVNLGAAKMIPGTGTIEVRKGDTILRGVDPSFIKIDVEGMEMQVLAGLSETLERARPNLLVEVDIANEGTFLEWASVSGYVSVRVFQRYKPNKNYLLRPQKVARQLPDTPIN